MVLSYETVAGEGQQEIVIQKSRFIGHAVSIENEGDAQQYIMSIKEIHKEASHNCYGYVLGMHNEIQRFQDDGEPGGTAGMPILEVIKSNGLTNTLVVVTRYFGGILLGAGGLVRAYSQGASEAIKAAGIIDKHLSQLYQIVLTYSQLGRMENFIRNSSYRLTDIAYLDHVNMKVLVKKKEEQQFLHDMAEISDGSIIPDMQIEYYDSWQK